jgi:hypothetical protein
LFFFFPEWRHPRPWRRLAKPPGFDEEGPALEAVSKLPQRDQGARDVKEGKVGLRLVFVAHDQTPEVEEPGVGALDDPSSTVAA